MKSREVHEYCKHAVVDLSITMQEAVSQVRSLGDRQKIRDFLPHKNWGETVDFLENPGESPEKKIGKLMIFSLNSVEF